jgi:hypothetical protein
VAWPMRAVSWEHIRGQSLAAQIRVGRELEGNPTMALHTRRTRSRYPYPTAMATPDRRLDRRPAPGGDTRCSRGLVHTGDHRPTRRSLSSTQSTTRIRRVAGCRRRGANWPHRAKHRAWVSAPDRCRCGHLQLGRACPAVGKKSVKRLESERTGKWSISPERRWPGPGAMRVRAAGRGASRQGSV